jgi:CRISPR-associated protein Csb1
LLDSTGSQSGRAETALWKEREMLRHTLPALILTGEIDQKLKDSKVSQLTTKARETAQALGIEVSSWEAAHRQIDTWFRAATMPDDKEHQLWDDSAKPATRKVKQVISTASANNGDLLYTYFPNAAIFGFWLSSGSSVRNKMPRAYSSEIVGYGAHPVRRASTKLDPVGGASKNTGIEFDGSRYVLTGKKVTEATRPSNLGFGQVPSAVEVRGFVCELIVQQAAISLGVLRSIVFHDSDGHTAKERATAAQTVLCLLALLGWKLSSQEGFLRSGCSLVSTDVKWGWRRHGSSEVEEMDVPSRDEIRDALDEAIDDAVAVGLPFADQTILHFSEEERQLITERVNEEIKTAGSDGE